ncbi:hypothetical protein TNCV_3301091 [Trichonephila clavipes]|nr:hypothetical protein TNCV_3301091 [Trichonephila clavipes]
MRNKEDILIKDLLLEEMAKELLEQREFLRNDAKRTSKPYSLKIERRITEEERKLRYTKKSLVYADKPQTLDHLEDNIRRVIADIRPQMLEKVIENWTSRLDYIRARRCSHMPEIIFKM